jgi:hypothetical protein
MIIIRKMITPYESVKNAIFYGTNLDSAIDVIKSVGKVNLSTLISETSHAFIDNCFDLYTPCHVGEWIRYNPELYDTEINVYKELLHECADNIVIDVVPYTNNEINSYQHVSEVSFDDRIRQIYTVCLME